MQPKLSNNVLQLSSGIYRDHADTYAENDKCLQTRVQFSVFSQIFDSVSRPEKTQNLPGVDSGNPDPWPTVVCTYYYNPGKTTKTAGQDAA